MISKPNTVFQKQFMISTIKYKLVLEIEFVKYYNTIMITINKKTFILKTLLIYYNKQQVNNFCQFICIIISNFFSVNLLLNHVKQ